jgi:hypothetical protein
MKYRGHTETVLAEDVSFTEIRDYIVRLTGRESIVSNYE